MDVAEISQFRREFALKARLRREDERDRQFADLERGRKQDKDKEEREHREQDEMFLVLATEQELAHFEVELDRYDTATVDALQDNVEAIDRSDRKLKKMLEDAYTLPDGTRVFRSADGLHVFDQTGSEVHDVDPAQIDEWRPSSEDYQAEKQLKEQLMQQNADLHAFQTELDSARKRVDDGHMTKGELADLEKRLKADAPAAVAQKVGLDMPTIAPSSAADAAPEKLPQQFVPAGKLDMPQI